MVRGSKEKLAPIRGLAPGSGTILEGEGVCVAESQTIVWRAVNPPLSTEPLSVCNGASPHNPQSTFIPIPEGLSTVGSRTLRQEWVSLSLPSPSSETRVSYY